MAVVAAAALLDIAGGLLFAAAEHIPATGGLYWAVATATTVGYGDVTPRTPFGRLIAVMVMLTVIPLFGATFSLFTAGITTTRVKEHVNGSEQRIKRHLEDRLKHHMDGHRGNPPAPEIRSGP